MSARRGDALFELIDSVLCAGGPVTSLPELSLTPVHRRGHGGMYDALACGRIEVRRWRTTLAQTRLPHAAEGRLRVAVDVTTRPRPLRCPLDLYECHFGGRLDLAKATGPDLSLRGSHLSRRLSARYLRLDHNLNLERLTCQGGVRLPGAHIGGQLNCTGATLSNPNGEALTADGAHRRRRPGPDHRPDHRRGLAAGAHISGQLACAATIEAWWPEVPRVPADPHHQCRNRGHEPDRQNQRTHRLRLPCNLDNQRRVRFACPRRHRRGTAC